MASNEARRAAVNAIMLNFLRGMRANGVGPAKVMLRIALAEAGGQPWTISGLATLTGCDRKTIRGYLKEKRAAGVVEYIEGSGWRLTPLGAERSADRFADAWRAVDPDVRALIDRMARPD